MYIVHWYIYDMISNIPKWNKLQTEKKYRRMNLSRSRKKERDVIQVINLQTNEKKGMWQQQQQLRQTKT